MRPFYLSQKIDKEEVLQGKITGVSYSGGIIKNFYGYENFIVDLATLTVAKKKVPILRDHEPSQVAGHGTVTIDTAIVIDGVLSKKTSFGSEIIGLAEDGFEWEQSIGVFDGRVEEIEDTEVNGKHIDHGWVLRDGVLREVSVVALGADSETFAAVLTKQKGEPEMLSKEKWIKFACACGGDENTTPEELEQKVKDAKLQSEEATQKIEELETEIAAKVAEIEKLKSEIEEIKEEDAIEEREEAVSMAAKAKGIKLSADKIKDAAKSQEKTDMLLSVIEAMEGKIDPKMTGKETISGGKVDKSSPESIRMAAKELVKQGKAANFIEAIAQLEVK